MFDDEKVLTPSDKTAKNYYGAKVLYADTYHELVRKLGIYENNYRDMNVDKSAMVGILAGWSTSSMSFTISNEPGKVFDFIYVLENPPLTQERPFKDTHELISVYKEKYGKTDSYYENELEMPLIGIKEIDTDKTYLIIAYSPENVIISSFLSDYTPQIKSLNMATLAASYCFLDNSGMVVTEVV